MLTSQLRYAANGNRLRHMCSTQIFSFRNNNLISGLEPRAGVQLPILVPSANSNSSNEMFPLLGNIIRPNLLKVQQPLNGQLSCSSAAPNSNLVLNVPIMPVQTTIDNTSTTNFPIVPQKLIVVLTNSSEQLQPANLPTQEKSDNETNRKVIKVVKFPQIATNLEQSLQKQTTTGAKLHLNSTSQLKLGSNVSSCLNIKNVPTKISAINLQQSVPNSIGNTSSVNTKKMSIVEQAIVKPRQSVQPGTNISKNTPTNKNIERLGPDNMLKKPQMTTYSKQTSITQTKVGAPFLSKKIAKTKNDKLDNKNLSISQTNNSNIKCTYTLNTASRRKLQKVTNRPEHLEPSICGKEANDPDLSPPTFAGKLLVCDCAHRNTEIVVFDDKLPPGYAHPFNYNYMTCCKSVNYSDIFPRTPAPAETFEDEDNDDDDNSTSDFVFWKCLYCFENQPTKLALLKHYENHKQQNDKILLEDTEEEFVECRACYAKFTTILAYIKHVEEHKQDYSKDFYCDICESLFDDISALVLHSYEEHTKPYWYQCPFCTAFTCQHYEVICAHISKKHENIKMHYCAECNKSFTGLNWYNNHALFHVKKPYECTICKKSYVFKREFIRHNRKTHSYKMESVTVKHECKICNMRFATHSSLNVHNLIHEIESYLCTVCGKTFHRQQNLMTHSKIHSDEKKYVCGICDKPFTKRETLVTHIRTHTGEKPFKCKVCGKGFAQRTPLRVHGRSHTGERPYKCFRCDRGFCSKGACDSHKKSCKK